MMSGFVERWVRRSEELAARHAGDLGVDLATEVAVLVAEARADALALAEPAADPAGLMERVSGRLRGAVPHPERGERPPEAPEDAGRGEALAALALQFSRTAGEMAGSPT